MGCAYSTPEVVPSDDPLMQAYYSGKDFATKAKMILLLARQQESHGNIHIPIKLYGTHLACMAAHVFTECDRSEVDDLLDLAQACRRIAVHRAMLQQKAIQQASQVCFGSPYIPFDPPAPGAIGADEWSQWLVMVKGSGNIQTALEKMGLIKTRVRQMEVHHVHHQGGTTTVPVPAPTPAPAPMPQINIPINFCPNINASPVNATGFSPPGPSTPSLPGMQQPAENNNAQYWQQQQQQQREQTWQQWQREPQWQREQQLQTGQCMAQQQQALRQQQQQQQAWQQAWQQQAQQQQQRQPCMDAMGSPPDMYTMPADMGGPGSSCSAHASAPPMPDSYPPPATSTNTQPKATTTFGVPPPASRSQFVS